MKVIHRMMSTLTESVEAMIESYVTNLDNRIVCIQRRIDALKVDYNASVDKLIEAVNDVRAAHFSEMHRLDRLETQQDLVITGIPYHQDEDLQHIYCNIARSIGIAKPKESMVTLRRLSKHPVRNSASPPILCHFAFRGLRDEFFNKYLHRRSLVLHQIGFQASDRIYVNERLSPHTRRTLKAAIKLRNEGHVHKVSTKKGSVFVIFPKSNNSVLVECIDQLLLQKSNLSK